MQAFRSSFISLQKSCFFIIVSFPTTPTPRERHGLQVPVRTLTVLLFFSFPRTLLTEIRFRSIDSGFPRFFLMTAFPRNPEGWEASQTFLSASFIVSFCSPNVGPRFLCFFNIYPSSPKNIQLPQTRPPLLKDNGPSGPQFFPPNYQHVELTP